MPFGPLADRNGAHHLLARDVDHRDPVVLDVAHEGIAPISSRRVTTGASCTNVLAAASACRPVGGDGLLPDGLTGPW